MSKGRVMSEDILVENSTYRNTHRLKTRLISEGLLEEICEACGIGNEWNGKPLSLQLDHKNGVNNDHRLENLRILCPNCHSQTDTYAGKNTKGQERVDKQRHFYCQEDNCDKEISERKQFCRSCSQKRAQANRRLVERPTLEILLKQIEDHGYVGTGRIYGVSDISIRKWVKNY